MHHWQGRKSCMMKELESLAGKLGHAAQVVQPGKTFPRRILYERKSKMGQSRGRFRLNTGIRSDILWWATFFRGRDCMEGIAAHRSSLCHLGEALDWRGGNIPLR